MNDTVHIARINYAEFYCSAFTELSAAEEFVKRVEAVPRNRSLAKIVLHQAARMLWLADRIDEVASRRPALQILFYCVAAEATAKMVFGFNGEGQSKQYTQRFFEEVCESRQQNVLTSAFSRNGSRLTLRQTVDLLYSVRCDVVHEGAYFEFSMREECDMSTTVRGLAYTAHISTAELRQVVLEGALNGVRKLLPTERTES